MKTLLLLVCIALSTPLLSDAEEVSSSPAVASPSAEKLADLERVLLKKLKDIEDRLERLERDRKTAEANADRKNDQLQRDVADTKRSIERMERTVQRLESKR